MKFGPGRQGADAAAPMVQVLVAWSCAQLPPLSTSASKRREEAGAALGAAPVRPRARDGELAGVGWTLPGAAEAGPGGLQFQSGWPEGGQ